MKLFIWKSEAMRLYGAGQIVTCANSVKAARAKVKEQALIQFRGKQAEFLQTMNDIAAEPEISDVLFVLGSD